VRRTHRKKRENAQVLEFGEGSAVAAAHDVDHFLEREGEQRREAHVAHVTPYVACRALPVTRHVLRITWLSLNADFSKQMAPGELPKKKPKSMWTT